MLPTLLVAGPLELHFNAADGSVRYLSFRGRELLRAIVAPVRDAAWGTIAPTIHHVHLDSSGTHFRLTFEARCAAAEIDFVWHGRIHGDADGRVMFEFTGEACSTFLANRIGFCVLHPAEVAGSRCRVEHVDGTIETSRLPQAIAAHQPFRSMRAITHEVAGVLCAVRMEGDTFEMEDQRNWTDASFKTYCTPLSEPAPRRVEVGTRIQQRISVQCAGAAPAVRAHVPWIAPPRVDVAVGPVLERTVPPVGALWDATMEVERGAALRGGLSHLRYDVVADGRELASQLGEAARVSAVAEVPVEIALHLRGPVAAAVAMLPDALRAVPGLRVARWIVYETDRPCPTAGVVEALRCALAAAGAGGLVGGGSLENFAELNRAALSDLRAFDFSAYGSTPQVHATDEASIVETIDVLGQTVAQSLAQRNGGAAVISPLTFPRRWRAGEAGGPCMTSGDYRLPPFQHDGRASSDFAAAWLLGSIAAAAANGVASITGPGAFGSGGLYDASGKGLPTGCVLRQLTTWCGRPIYHVDVSEPRQIAVLVVQTGDGPRAYLANLQRHSQQVRMNLRGRDTSCTLRAHEARVLDLMQ